MSRTRNKASNTANSSNNNTIFTLPYKDVEINCVVGNILNANTEAVASLCDTRFTLGSGLGKEIKDMLGDRFKIEAEVHKMKPAVPSQEAVAVKVSGSMGHIEWIILAPAGHADRKSLQVQYLEIINKATQMRIRSLTLPLLGTGQFGLDFRQAANFLKAALPMLPNLGNLERLNFIDLNERTMLSLRDFFQTEMVNNFPSSSSSNRQLQNGISSSNQSTSNGHNTVTRGRVKTPVTPADGYDGRRNCNDHLPTDIAINLGHMPNPNQGPQLPTISTSAAGDAGSSSGSSAIAQRSLFFNNGRNMSNKLARFLVAEPIADSDDEDSDTDPADVMEVTISSSNSSSSDEDSNSTDSDLEDSSDEEDDTNGDAIIISMQLDEDLAAAELDQEEERRFWTVVSMDKLTAGGGGREGHKEQKATTSSRAQQQLDDSTLPCSICLTDMREPMDPSDGLVELTLCSHMYHLNCIRAAFKVKKQCPLCMCWYGSPIGYQPENATMQVRQVPGRVPGHRNANGFHEITYHVPAGIQEEGHIRPGVPYSASTRIAYLPNNEEGTQVLKLLQVAFKRRLIFTVGDSVTTGRKNVPVWNGIHHKTNMDGGAQSYGYPDPGYLGRVREELASVGVQSDQLSC